MIQEVTTSAEVDTVVSVAATIWREYFPQVIQPAQIEYMLERFLSHSSIRTQMTGGYRYYLLETEQRVVGFMAVAEQGRRLHISKLYVHEDARGQGLAREALNFLETYCLREGLDCLWLRVNIHNALAISVYSRLGFHILETLVEDIGGGFVMDDYVMEKTINGH